MPIIARADEFNTSDLFVDLAEGFGIPLYLKCEGFNFAGSIKLKAAQEMVESAERRGLLRPGDTIVESSSGNVGVALSTIAAGRGYRFVCIIDPHCNETIRRQMIALGAEVHLVTEPDGPRGLVGARIAHARALCARHDDYVWLNQYDNPDNWAAHAQSTGPEIVKQFPDVDVLFIGAGTTGTVMGCARYFREYRPQTRIVAVDAAGSSLFGGEPKLRRIPGLGNRIKPGILDTSFIDEVVVVEEAETVRMCRRLARRGFLLGGSTGTVVSGAARWLAGYVGGPLISVAVSPDLGSHYLETIYRDEWVHQYFA
ncbi:MULTISPECIES: 2,3-diaminopropionate biosynthesis protein SbnA [unclassified Micromonospora]|uniref:2,3-diaminopropionate biosynthesis protein SbnA n=1 Tax=unclassified Micromonospora TaxID=2617518 RepID=UPI0022B5EAA0|nr:MULTISPECIES: 2,3-diaminopropionate biosynthesis protein SbnA [unclassified Micromonospora]MCZ7421940.1 2,3-diaminopropionate biosynthesis protein SbnA [Verrucosispora sp. WMMA2121]WBB93325.1 2,3-diaminopropionate biosynthesis protein SbnA [Verrucosispora sp. WMMC514]